jgi:hypothetical protein
MITFFNQFHNGDCFVGKGWVSNIMAQLPDEYFRYAHDNPPNIVHDLPCERIALAAIPVLDRMTKVGKDAANNLFVNTWCGAWQGQLFDYSSHSNYRIQHQMYAELCEVIGRQLGKTIEQSNDPRDYLPGIDYSYYDLERPRAFVAEIKQHRRMILVCNGTSQSGQSDLGDMDTIIQGLSDRFPDDVILVTSRRNVFAENIFYTRDINASSYDLNESAWLGSHASVVIGKNSGPFTWCQNRAALMDHNRRYISFSKKAEDNPMWGLDLPAQMIHSSTTNEIDALNFIIDLL